MHDIKHVMNRGDGANTGTHPTPFRGDISIKEMETFANRCTLTAQDFNIPRRCYSRVTNEQRE